MTPSDREVADFDIKIRRSTRDRLAAIPGKLTWDERVVFALDCAENARSFLAELLDELDTFSDADAEVDASDMAARIESFLER